jgi:hypothetical protein
VRLGVVWCGVFRFRWGMVRQARFGEVGLSAARHG